MGEKNLPKLTETKRKKLVETTGELYEKTQENIAPVIVGFADHLLKSLVAKGPETKIVFLARDGVGALKAAQLLLEKFPDEYTGVSSEQLVYAYFTRKTVYNSSADLLSQYLQQLGVNKGDKIVIADIGMYGTVIGPLKSKLSDLSITGIEYLISRTRAAKDFIDDGGEKQLDVLRTIAGNLAIHFLEDTYSGPIQSPNHLVETEMGIEPDTKNDGYSPEITIKRKFALRAIGDYVRSLISTKIDIDEAKGKLNDFLSDLSNFKDLMVPHER